MITIHLNEVNMSNAIFLKIEQIMQRMRVLQSQLRMGVGDRAAIKRELKELERDLNG